MLVTGLVIAGWLVLAPIATAALLAVCRSGEYEDHHRGRVDERETLEGARGSDGIAPTS